MPMIPDPIGLVPFVGIKLLGYSAAGAYLRQTALAAPEGDAPVIDVARAVGFGLPSGAGLPGMLLALAPLRALEWAVMLLRFFRAEARDRRFFWRGVLGGTLVSYLLDLPAWGAWSLFPRVGIC